MHEVLPSVNIVSIEKNEKMFEIAKTNVNEHNKEKSIQLIHGDALTEIDKLISIEKKFDFIFIDAAKAQYISYFSSVLPLMNTNVIIICDIVLFNGYVIYEINIDHHSIKKYTCIMRSVHYMI